MESIVYTRHSISSAAAEIADLYERRGKRVSIGFDAHGNVDCAHSGIDAALAVIVLDENTGLDYIQPDLHYADEHSWTEQERADSLAAIEWALSESTHWVVFDSAPEDVE